MLPRLVILTCFLATALSFLESPALSNKLKFKSSANGNIDSNVPLSLTCTFKTSDHTDFAKLLSIKLLKKPFGSKKFIDLLTVTESRVVDTDDFTGASTGYIFSDSTDSDLTAIYDHPTQNERGQYKCEARGLDSSERFVASESLLRIGQPNAEELLDCKKAAPRTSLTDLKQLFVECGASQANWFEMLRGMTQFDVSTSPDVFGTTPLFQSNSFYIITKENIGFNNGLSICKENNGYLAEINTEQEFLFLSNYWQDIYTKKPSNLQYLLLGASYQNVDEDFDFYTHPGAPMYLGHWARNEPHRNDMNYNWLILSGNTRNLEMSDGTTDHFKLGYLCEISKDI